MGCGCSGLKTRPEEVTLARDKRSESDVSSSKKLTLTKGLLEKKMELEYYFGCQESIHGANLYYSYDPDKIVYSAGKLCIVHDKITNKRQYLGLDADFSSLKGHSNNIEVMGLSQDRRMIATSSTSSPTNPEICIWSLETGDLVAQFAAQANIVSIAFNKTTEFIVLCDKKNNLYVYDLMGKQQGYQKSDDPSFSSTCVTSSLKDSDSFATIYIDGVIFWIFNNGELKRVKKKAIHGPDSMVSVTYSEDGNCYSTSCRGMVHIWKDRELIKTIAIDHINTIHKISCDKDTLYIGGSRGVSLCNLGNLQQKFIALGNEVIDMDSFEGKAIVGLKNFSVLELSEEGQKVIMGQRENNEAVI